MAAAAGIAAIQEVLDRDLPGNARSLEPYLKERLKAIDERFGIFGDIRGKGLFICVELVKNKTTKERFPVDMAIGKRIEKANLRNGLVHRAEPHWFIIAPPLVATRDDIDEISGIIEKSLNEVIAAL